MPRDSVLSFSGEFIVPLQAAHLIAAEFAADGAVWSQDAQRLLDNQQHMLARVNMARLEVEEALSCPSELIFERQLALRLEPHQLEAVAAMTVPSLVGLALFDEQGLGKTVMALCAFDLLRSKGMIETLMVLAPKSVLASWLSDIEKLFADQYVVRVVSGSHLVRRRRIRLHSDILLCSYEAAVSELDLLKRTLAAKPGRVMLVVDESYFVKNPNARRSKAVAQIRSLCDRAVVLCGTPAPNSAVDVVNQINIADGGIAFGNVALPSDPDAVDQSIKDALQNVVLLRRLKEHALPNLPRKEFERVYVELRPEQRALYEEAHSQLVLSVRSVDDREFTRHLTSFLALRMALLQICSNPGAVVPTYSEEPAKVLGLDRLLKDLLARREKVVIWSFFRYSLQSIADRYRAHGLVRVDGSTRSVEDRIYAIRQFQENPDVLIFLGNAAAAGAGITLTAAHHAIYESFSNQAAHYMQSIDRIHRLGQTKDVVYHVLLAHDTIEEGEFDRLLRKQRAEHDLLGDKLEEPLSRERFLRELGADDERRN